MRYLETIRVDIGDLEPFPGNARTHDDAALDESAEVNGQYRSVVARRSASGLQLLAGHGTVDAFARRGDADVRVEVIEADDTEARRIVLADNGTSRNAGYDERLLLELIEQASKDGGLPGTGWDEAALRALIASRQIFGDPDDADVEPPTDPVSRLGDVWELGWHRVTCGSATDEAVLAPLMRGDRADVMWTDPPYGVDYVGKTKAALTIKGDGQGNLPGLLGPAFAAALSALKPGAPCYVAHADTERMAFESALRNAGYSVRQNLIWIKRPLVLGHSDYHYRHEPILEAETPDPDAELVTHEPVLYGFAPGGEGRLGRGGPHWFGNNRQTTVFEFDKPARNAEHPTMKPVGLIGAMLRNSLPPAGMVLDMFGGSGSTLIATHQRGGAARLVELDPAYVDVICRRYQDFTGDQPVLERTGQRWDFTATPACEAA